MLKLLDGLTDAQRMAKKHPATFHAPSAEDLNSLRPGDVAKIGRNDERFWVLLTEINGDDLIGEVNNHLTSNPDLPAGKLVRFRRRHVLATDTVKTADDEVTSQAAYDRAADIAHEMIADLPARVTAADADPIDAAYALWTTFTGILLEAGWTACELADVAHEMQAEGGGNGEEESPSAGVH